MNHFTPKEIVRELDKNIVGQTKAKQSVAIALRNRWRRKQLSKELQSEIIPKNILMIGPTGVGKTEIARRLAKLDNAPFIKVEATKFTEVGYVGRDVEQIIRDLAEISIHIETEEQKKKVRPAAEKSAVDKIVDILAGANSSDETKSLFKKKLLNGELDDKEIEVKIVDKTPTGGMQDIPGMGGTQIGMISIDSILGKEKLKNKKLKVKDAKSVLTEEESENLLDKEDTIAKAIENLENNSIVFIDEIDKIASSLDRKSGEVSREGVQRDLLPLVEGTIVNTKYGPVKTDHILFVASGAFHLSKPADLLPELQGRFPIRVELSPLVKSDFKRILTEPQFNLLIQAKEMLKTEGVELHITEDAIDAIAEVTEHFNNTVENTGARRIHTILEKVLEDINFDASDSGVKEFVVDANYVNSKIEFITNSGDLQNYII